MTNRWWLTEGGTLRKIGRDNPAGTRVHFGEGYQTSRRRHGLTVLLDAFRQAATSLLGRVPCPAPRRRSKGGDGVLASTCRIVRRYVGLCHDPLRNLMAWADQMNRNRRHTKKERAGGNDEHHSTRKIVSEYIRLCRQPLQDLCGWMDASSKRRQDSYRVSARSGARLAGHDQLRPFRAERRGGERQKPLRFG